MRFWFGCDWILVNHCRRRHVLQHQGTRSVSTAVIRIQWVQKPISRLLDVEHAQIPRRLNGELPSLVTRGVRAKHFSVSVTCPGVRRCAVLTNSPCLVIVRYLRRAVFSSEELLGAFNTFDASVSCL